MDKTDAYDPYSRPARRTQWIVSTLAYHYGLDRGVENEIIVLATGLDQYLQEIFHHMDSQGDGKIPAEDFKILCQVLGLNKDCDLEECAGILENIPHEFTFRQFHAKLCGYFSTKAGCQYESGRLLVGRESEHIETQIRLRSPLRRRGKALSAGAKGRLSRGSSPTRDRHSSDCKQLGSCTRECYEEIVALEEAEDRIAKLEDENASLRELVEDMRAALQSSDARALALQVGVALIGITGSSKSVLRVIFFCPNSNEVHAYMHAIHIFFEHLDLLRLLDLHLHPIYFVTHLDIYCEGLYRNPAMLMIL